MARPGLSGLLQIVVAARRWRANVLECRRLLAELEPCEHEVTHGEVCEFRFNFPSAEPPDERGPCWKIYEIGPPESYTGYQDPIPVKFCGACQRNRDLGRVVALRQARGRRGGLTSALARAVDRFEAGVQEIG